MPKRVKRTVLNGECRELVVRLREYFERENQNGGPLLPLSQVCYRVADALGISTASVVRISKEKYGEISSKDVEDEEVSDTRSSTLTEKRKKSCHMNGDCENPLRVKTERAVWEVELNNIKSEESSNASTLQQSTALNSSMQTQSSDRLEDITFSVKIEPEDTDSRINMDCGNPFSVKTERSVWEVELNNINSIKQESSNPVLSTALNSSKDAQSSDRLEVITFNVKIEPDDTDAT